MALSEIGDPDSNHSSLRLAARILTTLYKVYQNDTETLKRVTLWFKGLARMRQIELKIEALKAFPFLAEHCTTL